MLMLTGCKEALDAEASMLDVLWSYCVSERAAGYEASMFENIWGVERRAV